LIALVPVPIDKRQIPVRAKNGAGSGEPAPKFGGVSGVEGRRSRRQLFSAGHLMVSAV
jgi:hypothetical protein